MPSVEEPTRVAVFGTGVMAMGIGRLCLDHGYEVVVLSSSRERADEARRRLLGEEPRTEVSTRRGDLALCGVFIESTVEDLQTKRRVLADIESHLPPQALVATTTSSLSIAELAAGLARPERFLGLHFFNPVQKMRLVEVVPGMRTDEWAVERGEAFVRGLGKEPLRVPDKCGFLVNRLLIPYLNRAARLVESGYATVEDVETAMRLGAGHRLGPFALIDLIGADVTVAIGRSLYDEYKRGSDAPSPELKRRVALGWLGRKTGRGYHAYREHPAGG